MRRGLLRARPLAFAADIRARISRLVPPDETICVGLSGGLDSTVLLDALSENMETAATP